MLSEGSRLHLLGVCLCLIGLSAGCTGIPAVPDKMRSQSQSENDEHEGWLWNSLTGQGSTSSPASSTVPPVTSAPMASPTASAPPPQGASQVAPTSYVAADGVGPLIPGPATPGAYNVPSPLSVAANSITAVPGPTVADLPPAIPQELPPPPPGYVSIKNREEEKKKAEKKSGFEWSDLAPENILKNVKAAAGYGPDEKIARAMMEEGKKLYNEASAMKEGPDMARQKKFAEAAVKFATAAGRWPDTPLEEDALFQQGDSEFFSDQYPKAHDTFGGLLKKYGNTRHLNTVVAREFRMGQYWEQLQNAKPMWVVQPNLTDSSRPRFDTFGYAIQAYERVRTYDPTGPLADHSLMAIANAYFLRGQYEDAAYNYDLLIKEYPNSKHQMNAHLFDLQAKMRIYQGTSYDGIPLKEAGKIADQTLTQFGNKLGAEQEHVAEARGQILEEKANRDFTRAQYYEQHSYYGAARLYYKSVIDDYPSTRKAKEARDRYEKTRSLPDEPPDRLKWLKEKIDKR